MEYTILDGPHEGRKVHTPGESLAKIVKIPFESDKFIAIYETSEKGLVLSAVEQNA